jgi:hypothetical protein
MAGILSGYIRAAMTSQRSRGLCNHPLKLGLANETKFSRQISCKRCGNKLKILLAREKKPNRNIEGNACITRTPKKRTGIYKEIKTVIV